jgi:DNA-directed RNA polymerase specialized sigma subunit
MFKKDIPDEKLIQNVKDGLCDESFLTLCERYNKIYFDICAKYSKKVPYIKYEDLIKDDLFVINKAIQTFNGKKKTKFSTWLSHMSRYYCLNLIKDNVNNQRVKIDCDPEVWKSILNCEKNSYKDDNSFIGEFIKKTLSKIKDKRILKIYQMRYFDDNKDWKDIAKEFNVTATYIKILHDIGRDFIKKEMRKD